MIPDAVADVGNTRIKWGRCSADAILESASLPADSPDSWLAQRERWALPCPSRWVVTGVHPTRRDRLAHWLQQQGDSVTVLDEWQRLPIAIQLKQPEQVGIDRLLNAVAANHRRPAGVPALIVGAGSAVTVDQLDPSGVFVGGAIFLGLRLQAQALHHYTALLPLIDSIKEVPTYPGISTRAAMATGIFWSVVGAVEAILSRNRLRDPALFLTGGDAALLAEALDRRFQLWTSMTLEGIRLTAADAVAMRAD